MARTRRPEGDPRADLDGLGLSKFIPAVSPRFDEPLHLPELVEAFEGVVRGTIRNGRYVVTVPMRHWKTYTILHGVAWALKKRPQLEIMYISYGANFAQRNSRKARRYALEAGVRLSEDHNTISEWMTTDGGVVLATGIDGEIAGRGADIVIIDDPIKSREKAESYEEREKATDFVQEAVSRLNDGGAVFLVSARWHVDDPSGQLLRTGEYTHIHKRAIEDEGLPTERALCPDKRPLDYLKRTRHEVGEYNWFSWFQGDPRPPDSNLFHQVAKTYRTAPDQMQIAIGIDLGFTKKGDSSVAIVLGRDAPKEYVLRRETWRKRIPDVARGLAALRQSYPTAPMFAYVSGPEIGTYDLLREQPHNIDVICLPARYNKFVRAMPTADAWNRGSIMVPTFAAWDVKGLCSKIEAFTGEEGGEDNDVDALVAAHDALDAGGASALEPGFYGSRCL